MYLKIVYIEKNKLLIIFILQYILFIKHYYSYMILYI